MASITTAISGKAGSISGTPGSGDIGSEITEWSIDDTVESLEATNMAENTIYTAEKTLKDAGDKAKPEDKREVEDKVMKLKELLPEYWQNRF